MKKLLIFILIIICLVATYFLFFQKKPVKKETKPIIDDYSALIITTKEKKLYDEEFNEMGLVNKDVRLPLDGKKKIKDKMYYKIKDSDFYIRNGNIEKIEGLDTTDRYKRYDKFNENIQGNNLTFYDANGYVFKINKELNLPIIIKDNNKLYVEYNNRLLYVNKSEVKVINHTNSNEKIRNNIRVFTYHAIFKPGEKCQNKVICHPYKQFDSHMGYLAKNNYLTLTMDELEMFLDKKINIPMKSTVITLDDGNLAQNAIEILDKYKLPATYFIITGKYDSYKLETEYVDFESHTDNMHHNWKCPGGNQGGQLLCDSEENIIKDLKTSQEKLGGSIALSYPFFDFNDRAIRLLKKCGFHMAFIGQYDTDGYSTFTTDKFQLRRKTIFNDDSLDTFIGYLK